MGREVSDHFSLIQATFVTLIRPWESKSKALSEKYNDFLDLAYVDSQRLQQIQPLKLRKQLVHSSAPDPRQQGLPPPRDREYCGVPCIAAVRRNTILQIKTFSCIGIDIQLIGVEFEADW
jgi:hypothetical protein